MDVLVTYDVATTERGGEARLIRMGQTCGRYGVRVQYSVFECRLSPVRLVRLMDELRGILDAAVDRVDIYEFAGDIRKSRRSLGRAAQRQPGNPWLL